MTRTNAYSLLCMIIRAIAVWSFCKAVFAIPGTVMAIRIPRAEGGLGFGVGWYLAAAALTLLILAGLWLFADKLAKLALVRPQDMTFDSSMDPTTWLGVLLSAIGAWFCLSGIVSAFYMAVRWTIMLRMDRLFDAEGIANGVADMASTALEVVLGAVLVLRGQGLSRWIHRMRYGVEQPAVRPEA